jgi:uncharacterized protein
MRSSTTQFRRFVGKHLMSDPTVVFDTVVFVRALINPHGIWGKLVFNYAHAYRLVLSRNTTKELVAVLARPELRAKFPRVKTLDSTALLNLIAQADLVETGPVTTGSRDPKDNAFLALAQASGADFLVTEDEDLLVLHSYRGTQIIRGAELYAILKEEQGGKAA